MSQKLAGKKVAFLVASEGVEQVELTDPWDALLAEHAQPSIVSTDPGTVQAFNHLDKADVFDVDAVLGSASSSEYDALVLPGGVANPDFLRMSPEAVAFARSFFDDGKPVAVICHGPWTLVEAGVVAGRTLTSWPSLRTDITNAGGTWVDEEVVVCTSGPNTLVSSRNPGDLPAFCAKLIDTLATVRRQR
ncbi:type 1 glutamine amidotransferase domain-containing protein [Rhodococcus sp. NPDC056506]|uniref:type 1 glutamine amidotransferase domain-containing protein n=1 Tax=Rhodococcus sp. NPDC056506 TaxID=3345844 RepID=UPI00366E4520